MLCRRPGSRSSQRHELVTSTAPSRSSPPAGWGRRISIPRIRTLRPATALPWPTGPGAQIANLEFVQFHPTALYPAHEHAFLISEAVRGEGAMLRRMDGAPLMTGIHHLESLAPRDIVARAIDLTMKERADPHVWLDLSPIPESHLRTRFPNIVAECEARGIDVGAESTPRRACRALRMRRSMDGRKRQNFAGRTCLLPARLHALACMAPIA